MKKTFKTIIAIFTFVFFAPFLQAQAPTQMSAIKRPPISQQFAGQYLPKLQEFQKLYEEKKFLEFYEESVEFLEKFRKSRVERDLSLVSYEAEELAFILWIYYYQLSAPLLTFHEIENGQKSYPWGYTYDVRAKVSAVEFLTEEDTAETAQLFQLNEKKYLRQQIENLATVLAFINKMYIYVHDMKLRDEENKPLRKQRNIEFWKRIAEANEKSKTQGLQIVSSAGPRVLKIDKQLSARGRRYSEIKISINSKKARMKEEYILKLVKCFPNQGRTVQDYVKKIGLYHNYTFWDQTPYIQEYRSKNPKYYSDNVELSQELGRVLRSKKDMEWVFIGIPSAQQSRKLMFEGVEKFKVEVKRRNEEKKRKKAEAEAKETARREEEFVRQSMASGSTKTREELLEIHRAEVEKSEEWVKKALEEAEKKNKPPVSPEKTNSSSSVLDTK